MDAAIQPHLAEAAQVSKWTQWLKLFNYRNADLRSWWRSQKVQLANSHIYINPSIVWLYDDLEAIQLGQDLSFGGFGEIVVATRTDKSPVAGRLVIGDRVAIGSFANIRAAGGEIRIGENTLIAQQVSLIASNHQVALTRPYIDLDWDAEKTGITIGSNVWIGAGVTILPGCTLGNNAVIGAGSVVTKNIPAAEIWTGIPATKRRDVL